MLRGARYGRRRLRGPYYIYLLMIEASACWMVVYVGMTCNPTARLERHQGRWCHSLVLDHFLRGAREFRWHVHMQIVDVCEDREKASERERWWIDDRLNHGDPIANRENRRRFAILEDSF